MLFLHRSYCFMYFTTINIKLLFLELFVALTSVQLKALLLNLFQYHDSKLYQMY